jgi:glucosylglycerate synthase
MGVSSRSERERAAASRKAVYLLHGDVLAPAEQSARQAQEPKRADIVVGVHGGADPGEVVRTGHRLRRQLEAQFPDKQAVVLLLGDDAGERLSSVTPPPVPGTPAPRVPLLPWREPGQSDIEAILRAAEAFDAAACALVVADSEEGATKGARQLINPILDDGFDFVAPCYAAHRFEGVLTKGVVYPLTRALFGKRLREPVGGELAVSRRLAGHLLGEGWSADPAHAGASMWLVTAVLSREFKVCQSYLGTRPRRLAEPGDLAAALVKVVGLLFHGMRIHAAAWQRVKGSQPVKTYGEQLAPEGDGGQPQVTPMLSAFKLGYQELGGLWGAVLPPQTLLALKRLAACPEEAFSFDDALWARIVYDFAVGYHLAVMDRALLLRSMTPLYLGWAAGFVREVREVDQEAVEARIERLCRAFEVTKPYLISRWRWPDRFNP